MDSSKFPTDYESILRRIDEIDPIQYGKTRNFKNGKVTKLSPYISRGVISTRFVTKRILAKGYSPNAIKKILQELAWRDYFQNVWMELGDKINQDIKHKQEAVSNQGISTNIVESSTQIEAIDKAIQNFYETGYMHNHMRMYVASICCNIGLSHWKHPAQWMYYHLLDADWASNALSWQWVAGSFSNKKYYANQGNINKYFDSHQKDTFLDVSYEAFGNLDIPTQLRETEQLSLDTTLPQKKDITIDSSKPSYIYTFYNLDPQWGSTEDANRILLLEPSFFKKYPVSDNTLDFIFALSKNIPNIQVFVGEFDELFDLGFKENVNFKEHPTNRHFEGIQHERDWLFPNVKGYFPSFFKFWKKGKKQLKDLMPSQQSLFHDQN